MKNLTVVMMAMFLCLSSYAETTNEFDYSGQIKEEVTLEQTKEVTLYKTEYVDGTCERQEPYVENECGYETKYRSECHWEPARDHCYNDSDYVCRNVTRHREVCKRGPSRQSCHNEPSKRVCRTRNGEQRCRDVPGRRVCRTVPGKKTCRREPYQDRQCDTVTRRRCDRIPGQNVCKDVPYQDYVCRDVTKYKTVQYACQKPIQVPYQAEKKIAHKVKFEFSDTHQLGSATIKSFINEHDALVVEIKNGDSERTFIQATFEREIEVDTDEEFSVTTNYKVNFGSKEELLKPLSLKAHSLWINKAGKLKLTTVKSDDLSKLQIGLDIIKRSDEKRIFRKILKLEDFALTDKKKNTELFVNLGKHGFKTQKTTFGTALKLNVFVRLAVETPKDLIEPIGQPLFVVKKFSVKAYKNK